MNNTPNKCTCDLYKNPTYHASDNPHRVTVHFWCYIHHGQHRDWLIHTTKEPYCVGCQKENGDKFYSKDEWQKRFLDAGTLELGIDCSALIPTVSQLLSTEREKWGKKLVKLADDSAEDIKEAYERGIDGGGVMYQKGYDESKQAILQELLEGFKKYFEANMLDGDKVQKGQMISSLFMVEVVEDFLRSYLDKGINNEQQ